jgi:hypothetical protein
VADSFRGCTVSSLEQFTVSICYTQTYEEKDLALKADANHKIMSIRHEVVTSRPIDEPSVEPLFRLASGAFITQTKGRRYACAMAMPLNM